MNDNDRLLWYFYSGSIMNGIHHHSGSTISRGVLPCHSQVHHCDMALDLALTLVYLEDLRNQVETKPELRERCRDAFNLICYMAFLAHAFNSDRPIRLADWFKEIGHLAERPIPSNFLSWPQVAVARCGL